MEFYKTYKIANKLLMKSVLSFYIHIKRKSNAKLFAFDFNLIQNIMVLGEYHERNF